MVLLFLMCFSVSFGARPKKIMELRNVHLLKAAISTDLPEALSQMCSAGAPNQDSSQQSCHGQIIFQEESSPLHSDPPPPRPTSTKIRQRLALVFVNFHYIYSPCFSNINSIIVSTSFRDGQEASVLTATEFIVFAFKCNVSAKNGL